MFVCIMTSKYQASVNCTKEYNYADACRKRIVPIKAESMLCTVVFPYSGVACSTYHNTLSADFTPTGALGLIIAGLLYIQVLPDGDFVGAMDNLYSELEKVCFCGGQAIETAVVYIKSGTPGIAYVICIYALDD